MKKHLFVLCFLLGLVGTHAWAQFRNTQLYYVTQPYRNNTSWAIAYNGTKLQSNVDIDVYTDANDSRQQFAVLSNDCGNTRYLYHAAEKKFVNKDGSLSNEPYDPIYFKNGAYNSTFIAYFDESHYINVNSHHSLVVNNWSTPDGGNSCVIYIVSSSFDPTEALLKFGWYIDNTGHLVVAQDYSYNNDTYYPWHAYREQITSVEIREGVGEIGAYAFYRCSNLQSITIPTSINAMGTYAFAYCSNLTEVHISSMDAWMNIDFLGEYANPLVHAHDLYLNGKLITNLVIPNHVSKIKNFIFDHCNLTSVTLHSGVTSLGKGAFSNCKSLTNVISFATTTPTIASDFTISSNAVLYHPSGSNYTAWSKGFSKTLPFITSTYQLSNTQLYYVSQPFRNITSWAVDEESNVLKSNVEVNMAANSSDACQQFAFISNDGGATRYMYYPANKKFVGKDGSLTDKPIDPIYFKNGAYKNTFFAYFDESHQINVNSSRQMTIDNWSTPDGGNSCILVPVATFDPTEALIKMGWSFNESTGHLIIEKDYSYNNDTYYPWHAYREQITSVEIREGVGEIGAYAFSGCSNLPTITIPTSIYYIGAYAFNACNNLTEVHISSMDNWLNIDFGGYFSNPLTKARNLYLSGKLVTTLVVPDHITEIKNYAFDWCSSLTSITLHADITSIGNSAFSNCSNLTNVISFATGAPQLANDNPINISPNAVLYYPSGSNYTSWQGKFSKALPFITSINQLSNTQLYYVSQPYRNITSWAVDKESNVLKSNVEVNMAANSSDACQQFAFISNDGGTTHYMYYPANKKFVGKDGSLTDKPTDPIYFKNGAYKNTFFAHFDENHYINVNSHHSLVVNNWNTPDGGNSCILVPVATFDPTEALKAFSGSDIKDVIKDNTELTIHDLKGRKIQVQHLEELPEGIYIINGKKTVIK